MEFKGTKGKWKVIEIDFSDFKQVCIASVESNPVLAHIYLPEYKITDELKANALLISKAPDYHEDALKDLELLEKVAKQLDDLGGYLWDDVMERIAQKKQLIEEATNINK